MRTPRLQVAPGWRRTLIGGAIGLAAGLVLVAARPWDLIENVELRLLDLQTAHFRLEREPDERIVVSEILDDDVAAIRDAFSEPWPWGLELTSYAFQVMADAGVQAVLVDVYQLDRGAGRDDYPDTGGLSEQALRKLDFEAEQAEAFGAALTEVERVALAIELTQRPIYDVEARRRAAEGRYGAERVRGGPRGIVRHGVDLPIRRAIEGASLLAFANVSTDLDGIVRRAPLVGQAGERRVISLPLAAALLATGDDAVFEEGRVRLGGIDQAVMDDGSFVVNFHETPGSTYPRVSPAQLLEWARRAYLEEEPFPEEAKAALEGKIVVWGINLAGLKDIVTAPVSGTFHGPEYQATILDNLLHGDGRVRASRGYNAAVLLTVTLALGLLGGLFQGKRIGHAVPLLVVAAGMTFALWNFTHGTALDIFTPFLGVVLTWGGTSVAHLLTAGRRNRWLQGTFGRYLAPSIIEALKEDPSLLELGGRRREVTILFSDVAGFTRISEALEPEQLVELLNRYLTSHCASVMEEGGVVDKFIGDAVVAFFGDPIPMEDHALRACRTALEVQERIPRLRPLWESFGLEDFAVRIGLNTGTPTVGNMGSDQRFDYTVLGDAVNLASRLEGANKNFGSEILIGSATYAEAGEEILARPIGGLVVVGRTQPEPVYELLAMREGAPDVLVRLVEAFERAQAAARTGDRDGALAALDEAEALRPGDRPSAWFRGLVEDLDGAPWDGVVVLKGK